MIITTEILIQLFELLVGITILILFFCYPWQSILIDMTRQRLIEIRNDIFLYADDDRIDFDSKIHKDIIYQLNCSIRYCHKVKISNAIAFKIATQKTNAEEKIKNKTLLEIVSDIEDADLRNDLKEKVTETELSLITLMILRSPFLLLLIMLLIPLLLIDELLNGYVKKMKTTIGSMIERDIIYESRKYA